MASPWRKLVHLQVSKLTRRHVGSWPWSALIAYGLEPFDPVGGRLVHNWAAAILKSAREVSFNLVLACVIRGVVGAWRRGVVSFLGSEPLLTWRPIGSPRILYSRQRVDSHFVYFNPSTIGARSGVGLSNRDVHWVRGVVSTALHFDVSAFGSHSQKFVFVLAWSGKSTRIFNLWVFRHVYILVDFMSSSE